MTIEALVNAVGAVAEVSVELSSGGTELHVNTTAPEALREKFFRLKLGSEVMLATCDSTGASPWRIVTRNVEPVVGGSGAVSHPIGTKVFQELTVAGLENAAVPAPNTVGPAALQGNSVGANAMQANSVGPWALQNNAVETPAVADEQITETKLKQGSEAKLIPVGGEAGNFLKRKGETEVEWSPSAGAAPFLEAHVWPLPVSPSGGINGGLKVNLKVREEARLVRIDYRIAAGTKIDGKILKNGTAATGFSSFEATGTEGHLEPAAVALANEDKLQLELTTVEGTGLELTVTLERQPASPIPWFGATEIPLIESGALASDWTVIFGLEEVEGSEVKVKLGEAEAVLATVASIGPDVETWATIVHASSENAWLVAVRGTGTADFYYLEWKASGEWKLAKSISESLTTLAEGTAAAPATGNSLAVRAVGGTVGCAIKQGKEVTVLANEVKDSSIATTGKAEVWLIQTGCGITATGAAVI